MILSVRFPFRALSALVLLVVLVAAPNARGQAGATVPDPDPELERKALEVPEGFEISLFAADPLLAKPIQMNFDPAGRLWVATSETYPQIKPGQKANDKILVLEDTDGDGKADKVTVFADGLLIPTGIEPGDGGVYVGASTELLHLSRPEGDKGPLRKRVVLSGFGTEDTHHIIHTLRWGHDGMLYFNQSIYIHSHIETPFGVRRLGGGGIWQFRPETGRLEVFARGWWNSWGHHFDRFGQSFITDGAGGEGVNYGIPGASYTATPGAVRVLTGLNPGHPKYCGCEIISGRHMPESWRGTLVTNDFRANRVCRFSLIPDGSGYAARQEADVVRTRHGAFRPVDVKMGPDGALYIADWYNPIIQHGEVDFRDPRRDHTHGRIWRLTAKGRPLVPRPRLVGATTAELFEALKSEEGWTRQQARRVLKERGAAKVLSELDAWTAKLPTGAASEPLRLESLWTYQSLDVVKAELLRGLLAAVDHRVRAAAVRVAGAWHDRLPDCFALIGPRAADEQAQVRLEAVRALSLLPEARAADAALKALDFPLDRNLDYALWLTLRELEPQWMPALEKGSFPADGSTARLLFAVQARDSSGGLPTLARLARSGKLSPAGETAVLALLAERGGAGELALVLDKAVAAGDAERSTTLLLALERAASGRHLRPGGDLRRLVPLLKAQQEPLRVVAVRLAGAWKLEEARAELASIAQSKTAETVRIAALEGLVSLGGAASGRVILDVVTSGETPLLRRKALVALLPVDPRAAAAQLPSFLVASGKDEESSDLFNAFLERKDGIMLLTDALRGKKLPADVAKVGVRVVRSSLRPGQGLIDELTRAGSLTTVTRTLNAEQMTQLVRDVTAKGDAGRGEGLFRRKDMLCLQCHAIGGAGGQVGPDLSSIGASAPVDYLIDSLFLPSKAIKENYHSLLVTTTSGRQYTGVKVRQTKDTLVLRTANDRELTIPIKEIDEQVTGGSLMPEGLVDPLTQQELLDLVRLLSELGKAGPYAIGKARVVRRWQVLEATAENEKALARGGRSVVLGDDPALVWSSAYSKVSGALPIGELGQVRSPDGSKLTVVRCRMEATAAGKVGVRLSLPAKTSLFLDGKAIPAADAIEMEIAVGGHTLTMVREGAGEPGQIRCELEDVAGSAARVTIVGGK
jgi:putative heme-binding domain-containing protein